MLYKFNIYHWLQSIDDNKEDTRIKWPTLFHEIH